MNSKQHSAFTGEKASISTREGGKFSVFGGYASGKNLELKEGKKIVQSWRASDWKDGEDSVVTFEFSKSKTGCKLTFTHKGVPADQADDIKKGWIDYYWTPLKSYVQKGA